MIEAEAVERRRSEDCGSLPKEYNMFVVPAPGHDSATLHAAGVSAPVVDGFAVSEDEAALTLLAECFGLGKVEAAVEQPATPAPAPVVEAPELHVWADDGGLHVQE